MSSVTFCSDTLDTSCDLSAFLVVIESQPGMHGRGDSWAPQGDCRDAWFCVEFLINKILSGSSQTSQCQWFEHDSEFIPFHHSLFSYNSFYDFRFILLPFGTQSTPPPMPDRSKVGEVYWVLTCWERCDPNSMARGRELRKWNYIVVPVAGVIPMS